MTREEAIKILRKEIECLSHTKCEDCILEAVCDPMKTPCDSEYIEVFEMAIKELEQNPCEPVRNSDQLDCVNRQAVMDTEYQTIDINGVEYVMLSEVQMKMRKLPSVSSSEKPNKWIPVSEDLPKDAYGCIVTVLDVDLRTQNEFENILPYFVGYDGETWNNADGEPISYEVIAWMKAPEPYKAESEVQE